MMIERVKQISVRGMGSSNGREAAATMPETANLGFRSAGMFSPSGLRVTDAGEAEAIANGVADLKLGGGPSIDGTDEGLGPETEAKVEKEVIATEDFVDASGEVAVSKDGPEQSEVERAWKGQEEWNEGGEVTVGTEDEGKNDVPQDKGAKAKFSYPQRPGEPDCAYYIRTGYCAFGSNCKFNHPHRVKRILVVKSSETDKHQVKVNLDENSSSAGRIQCKYYQTPGGCKYGSNCRYLHEKEESEVGPELNFLGLPMRPGEKECPFFMQNGSCKFGPNCRFHHPNPTVTGEPTVASGYHVNGSTLQYVSSGSQASNAAWSSQNLPNQSVPFTEASLPYVPGVLLPHNPEWSRYQAARNSSYSESCKKYSMVQPVYEPTAHVNGRSGHVQPQTEQYPERPGQPDCQFYMDNGTCKYKSACRFNHPKDRLARSPVCLLSPMGLPLRPDQPVCTFYSRYGICKFGPTCKYDHPMDRGSSKAQSQATTIS